MFNHLPNHGIQMVFIIILLSSIQLIDLTSLVEGSLNGKVITTDISQNTNWTPEEGPYYIFNKVKVSNGATLQIKPMTTVYLLGSSSLSVSFGASLIAAGSSGNSLVHFKSITGIWDVQNGLFNSVNCSILIGNNTVLNGTATANNNVTVFGNNTFIGNNTFSVNGTNCNNNSIFLGSTGYSINVDGIFYKQTTQDTCRVDNALGDVKFSYCNFEGFDKIQLSGSVLVQNSFINGKEFRVSVGSVLNNNMLTLTNFYSEASQSNFYRNSLTVTSEYNGVANVVKGCWRENSYGQNLRNPLMFQLTHAVRNTFSVLNVMPLETTMSALENNFLNIGEIAFKSTNVFQSNVISKATTVTVVSNGNMTNCVFSEVGALYAAVTSAVYNVFTNVDQLQLTLPPMAVINRNALYDINKFTLEPDTLSTIIGNSIKMKSNFSVTVHSSAQSVDLSGNYWGTNSLIAIQKLQSMDVDNANIVYSPFLSRNPFDYPFQMSNYETYRYNSEPFLTNCFTCVVSCFGVVSTDSSVCSSNGYCTNTDLCTCNSGFFGNKCDSFACYGIESTNSTVCAGRGICRSPNKCYCPEGFAGSECQTPIVVNNAINLNPYSIVVVVIALVLLEILI